MTATEILNNNRKYLKGVHVSFKAYMKNKNAEACKAVICFKHRIKLLKGHTGYLTLYALSIFKQTRKLFPLITKYVHGVNSVTNLTAIRLDHWYFSLYRL